MSKPDPPSLYIRRIRAGLCGICGKDIAPGSKRFCAEHFAEDKQKKKAYDQAAYNRKKAGRLLPDLKTRGFLKA